MTLNIGSSMPLLPSLLVASVLAQSSLLLDVVLDPFSLFQLPGFGWNNQIPAVAVVVASV